MASPQELFEKYIPRRAEDLSEWELKEVKKAHRFYEAKTFRGTLAAGQS